uniref:Uncharacterized protein n=1 Tax=Kalanchoe fedtschenkoi TaxID=63787 RepID=A0A7N0VKC1_KALFE
MTHVILHIPHYQARLRTLTSSSPSLTSSSDKSRGFRVPHWLCYIPSSCQKKKKKDRLRTKSLQAFRALKTEDDLYQILKECLG